MKSFHLRLSDELYETLTLCKAMSRRSLQNEVIYLVERGIEAVADQERQNGGASRVRRRSSKGEPTTSSGVRKV